MGGELWKLKEDKPAPGITKTRRLVLVGIAGLLLIGGGAYLIVVRAKASRTVPEARDPYESRGLMLVDTRVTFAVGVIQTVDIRLPCSGLLSINLSFPKGTGLNVFLVTGEEREKMKARQTFSHVNGFDAKTNSGSYRHAEHLPSGAYCLVLLDESASRSVIQVSAQLTDLK